MQFYHQECHTCRLFAYVGSNYLHCMVASLNALKPCRYVHMQEEFLRREKEVMKDVPGYTVGEALYSGGRWMPPAPRVGGWGNA